MKTLIGEVKDTFSQYGYRKERNSFWKKENGFYKLVNFQSGAYGDYFFINVGLHPIGLPSLTAGKLEIKERPRECECIFRRRMGEISPLAVFKEALVSVADPRIVQAITNGLPDVEAWFTRWGSFEAIAACEFSDVEGMLSCVPLLWNKAYRMLKCYCLLKLGRMAEAEEFYSAYLAENREMDFSAVDQYLKELLDACGLP